MPEPLCGAIAAKLAEQIDRVTHLIGLASLNRIAWTPPIDDAWPLGQVLGHLLDCLAGCCAVLCAVHPAELPHFLELQKLPVNQLCAPAEACERIEIYRRHLEQGFAILTDADLARRLPTIFVAGGELVLTLFLGNLEHVINHKHQLFMYLKLLGVQVGTPDLYQFRGETAL